jgi:hypothetical protein
MILVNPEGRMRLSSLGVLWQVVVGSHVDGRTKRPLLPFS